MLERVLNWLNSRPGFAVIGFVLGAIVSGPLGDFGSHLWQTFQSAVSPPTQTITLDFNASHACNQGVLTEIRKSFDDPRTPLTNGADMLTICDKEPLRTTRPSLPWDLAGRFKGCLVWRGAESGGLLLVRKSKAVCALPGDKGFICDGAEARQSLGNNAVGDAADAVETCPDDILRKFGFAS
ncbi:hypothetical protein [Mesorhizobium sp.]|uniref:hypothetical protein n=1 Tax=Mesorhizobium sp. TaxID=1871066 RepID=UPI000FE8AA18|nr:hypothetical protein [Mesorhizobium sp.]RWD09558.1 MAG: hypothetical protein EOS74_31210 [Mesorhizobium sp.]RWF66283.1 MAG: hypothetical protein EOS47_06770 [Mesorhizobium sp.]